MSGRGQVLAQLAIVVPVVLLPVAALAVGGAQLAQRSARLHEVAAQAAEDAAQQIDVAALRARDEAIVDPLKARAMVAEEVGAVAPAARVTSVRVTGRTVEVRLEDEVSPAFAEFLLPGPIHIDATATGVLVTGYRVPSG
jgi:type II secretory pathway pseudopilin PulG